MNASKVHKKKKEKKSHWNQNQISKINCSKKIGRSNSLSKKNGCTSYHWYASFIAYHDASRFYFGLYFGWFFCSFFLFLSIISTCLVKFRFILCSGILLLTLALNVIPTQRVLHVVWFIFLFLRILPFFDIVSGVYFVSRRFSFIGLSWHFQNHSICLHICIAPTRLLVFFTLCPSSRNFELFFVHGISLNYKF